MTDNEEHQPFTSPEDLGESQVKDAEHMAAPGGPGGTGKPGYRRIAAEGDDEYHQRKNREAAAEEAGEEAPGPMHEDVSDEQFHQAVQRLSQDRRHQAAKRRKSA